MLTPERQAALKELQALTADMDIPEHRRVFGQFFDLNWLARNLGVRNKNHPNFEKARQMIRELFI